MRLTAFFVPGRGRRPRPNAHTEQGARRRLAAAPFAPLGGGRFRWLAGVGKPFFDR